jgi:hypothetical protein
LTEVLTRHGCTHSIKHSLVFRNRKHHVAHAATATGKAPTASWQITHLLGSASTVTTSDVSARSFLGAAGKGLLSLHQLGFKIESCAVALRVCDRPSSPPMEVLRLRPHGEAIRPHRNANRAREQGRSLIVCGVQLRPSTCWLFDAEVVSF